MNSLLKELDLPPETNVDDVREAARALIAELSFIHFVQYTKSDYKVKWFHEKICAAIDDFILGNIKRLIITVPPQHGKSQISSRHLPAYALGKNPDTKVAVISYSATLANTFNKECQRIIVDSAYQSVFPDTKLSRQTARTDSSSDLYTQTQNQFDIVGHQGFYKSVGIGGSLTGTPVDIAIIDDPFKDDLEASSELMRKRVWQWYRTVLQTRLHNDSRVLITMTRWHEDDLVGRVLKIAKSDPLAPKWHILNFEGIREDMSDKDDPRQLGEALWEERHSADAMLEVKRNAKKVFYSIYQGKPAPDEGDILKSKWFDQVSFIDILKHATEEKQDIISDFFIDSAFTDDQGNDPTAIMKATHIGNYAYILDVVLVWLEFPDLIKFIIEYVDRNDYNEKSRIYIEPKASGKSIAQTLRKKTGLNVIDDIDFVNLQDSKVVRANAIAPDCESRRVKILKGGIWIEGFFWEIDHFPNATHDDQVDDLIMMVNKYLGGVHGDFSWRGGE